jgi:hypothetical protein
MWGKLIEIIVQLIKEKPRSDLLVDLLWLRSSMHNCITQYRKVAIMNKVRVAGLLVGRRNFNKWRESIYEFGAALRNLDDVLGIYSSDALRECEAFFAADSEEQNRKYLSLTEHNYEAALAGLDDFIKQTFKPEEVMRASQALEEDKLRKYRKGPM